MSNMNSMNTNSTSKINVPEAKNALNNMKYEIANELGVNLKQGYNGDLTSREAGYIGGYMVKNMCPERSAIYLRKNRKLPGYCEHILYGWHLTI